MFKYPKTVYGVCSKCSDGYALRSKKGNMIYCSNFKLKNCKNFKTYSSKIHIKFTKCIYDPEGQRADVIEWLEDIRPKTIMAIKLFQKTFGNDIVMLDESNLRTSL